MSHLKVDEAEKTPEGDGGQTQIHQLRMDRDNDLFNKITDITAKGWQKRV